MFVYFEDHYIYDIMNVRYNLLTIHSNKNNIRDFIIVIMFSFELFFYVFFFIIIKIELFGSNIISNQFLGELK